MASIEYSFRYEILSNLSIYMYYRFSTDIRNFDLNRRMFACLKCFLPESLNFYRSIIYCCHYRWPTKHWVVVVGGDGRAIFSILSLCLFTHTHNHTVPTIIDRTVKIFLHAMALQRHLMMEVNIANWLVGN